MKILIIDDHPEYKCREILEVCESRGIEVVVKKARNPGLREIVCSGNKYDGIILDMGLPIYEGGRDIGERVGDEILAELRRKELSIPVLIFSETESKYKHRCDFVFDQMMTWNVLQEEEKFYKFLAKLEEKN